MKELLALSLVTLSIAAHANETLCGKLMYTKVIGLEDMGFIHVLAQDVPSRGMIHRNQIDVILEPQIDRNYRVLNTILQNHDYSDNTEPEICIRVINYYDSLRTDGSSIRTVNRLRVLD